jgi:hypothetical protein
MKSHPMEQSSIRKVDGRTDRRTDMKELIITFHSFANKPKTYETGSSNCLLHIFDFKNKQLAPTLGQLNPTPFFKIQFI